LLSDGAFLAEIRAVLASPVFVGEGHRKVWSRLRYERGMRTSMRRTFRIKREHHILACSRPVGVLAVLRGTRFEAIEGLKRALRDFAHRFDNHWIIGRIGYRTPAAHRRILLGEAA
jgi:hypothetical protein